MIRPCPANGLARAEWFRELAAECEVTDPVRAIYCRDIAAKIEGRELDRPLVRIMSGEHVTPPSAV